VFDDALRYLVQGVPLGAVYGLVALGLVLTYKTSGVFNLAFGAQAFLSASLFNDLRTHSGWGIAPAFLVAVVIVAPLVGLLLDRVLFRFLRSATWQVKLITSLGLLTGLPEVVKLIFGQQPVIKPAALVGNPESVVWRPLDQVLKAKELAAISTTLAVVAALFVVFRYTPLGLQMRAIVESPRMVELAGVNSERVGMAAWMMSSLMAGLAGVLLAPLYGQIDANSFTTLLVVAIAAAAVGRLTSLPLALAGALALGVAQQTFNGELDANSPSEFVRVLYEGLGPSLPFVLLFLVLILTPAIRNRREATDPLRGVDPPPPNLAVTYHDARLRRINQIAFPTFIIAVILGTQTWVLGDSALSPLWVSRFTDGIVLAVTLLSITAITGLSGQVSLAQATFAGIGGYSAAQLATDGTIFHADLNPFGGPMSTIAAILVGAAFAAIVGALVAIPSLRLGGIYLTLATLGFALAADAVLFKLDSFTGGADGIIVPEPSVFAIALDDDRKFFLFAFVVFAIVGTLVRFLRKGTIGRELAAIRGSEVAAPAIGVNPTAARIKIFAFSAGIAGVGGGLFSSYLGAQFGVLNESNERFNVFFGFILMVVVISVAVRTVDGAVIAGLSFVLFPLLLEELGTRVELAIIGFAFGAITFARHPEGIAEFQKLRNIRAQIRHRALAAEQRELADAERLGPRPLPTLVMLAGAAPALLLMLVFAITGTHLGPTEVLLYGLVLTVPIGVVGGRAMWELVRLRRSVRDLEPRAPFTWLSSLFPAFLVVLNVLVQMRRDTTFFTWILVDEPTTLGWVSALGLGTIVVVGWLGHVLWAITDYRVAAARVALTSEPSAPVDAPSADVAPTP
jgi:branched-subunit amino acid ABC-type transport system permease component